MMRTLNNMGGFLLVALLLATARVYAAPVELNLDHLRALQAQMEVEGTPCTVVHIYAEAPDYHWVGDEDEGVACVDDAARAARLYLELWSDKGDSTLLKDARGLLRFVLTMQTEDGQFWNFVLEDGTINRTHRTSRASLGWWAARGFRSIALALETLPADDPLRPELNEAAAKTLARLIAVHGDSIHIADIGYDTAAEWTLGLLTWRQALNSDRADDLIQRFAGWIEQGVYTGGEEKEGFPYLVHLSWQNIWHAWGMLQVEALARAGETFGVDEWIASAVVEGTGFQRWQIAKGMWNQMVFSDNDTSEAIRYPQIAYGVGSLVACQAALYEVTGDSTFATGASLAAGWFTSDNAAQAPMYDPATGRGYDGLIGPGKRNMNSGAESTIEALLALAAIQRHPVALAIFGAHRQTEHSDTRSDFIVGNQLITLTDQGSCWTLKVARSWE